MADRLRQFYDAARDLRRIDPWTWARPVVAAALALVAAACIVAAWRAPA